jgi:SAM-dependent methyltransferase
MAVMQPRDVLSNILSGQLIAEAVSVATRLGIPDLVARRARRIDVLARATRSHPESLYRFLRALASAGVFTEKRQRRFGRTPVSDLLRRGVPGSWREVALLSGEPWRQASYALAKSLRTGRSAFETIYGMSLYSYLARRPGSRRLFTDVMARSWIELSAPIVRTLDCERTRRIIDVGGGSGSLLQALLEAHPGVTGVVFDVPAVAAAARRRLAGSGLGARCRVVAGDFFDKLPPGGDLYLLVFVLHNWDDRRGRKILERCRQVMSETARLVVIEMIVPTDTRPSRAKTHDLEMLVFTPGRERTAEEYRALFRAAGLRLRRIVSTGTVVSLIEAVRPRNPG